MGISTSGNSKNVVAALKMASAMGLATIGLTGGKDCAMDQICEVTVKAPETETFKVQEYHLPIYHYLCATLEKSCLRTHKLQSTFKNKKGPGRCCFCSGAGFLFDIL